MSRSRNSRNNRGLDLRHSIRALQARPDRWDEYIMPSCLLFGSEVLYQTEHFQLLWHRWALNLIATGAPRLTLFKLSPPDGEGTGEDIQPFVNCQKQAFKETGACLKRRHKMKVDETRKRDEPVMRQSPGLKIREGNLVLLVKVPDSRLGLLS